MIIDLQARLSGSTTAAGVTSGQAVTATAISENVIDLRNASTPALADEALLRDPLYLVIQCTETTVSAGATTCTFSLESDSTADLATSATVHWTSSAIAKATLVAGYIVARVKLPLGDYERYLGLRYTVAVANFSAGKFLAYLTPGVDRQYNFASGFSVS